MKLEEIQRTFKESSQYEDITAVIQEARIQIEEIYKQYDIEIDNAERSDIKVHYFCFTEVIESYPDLDFENKVYWREGHYNEQSIEDNYALLIDKLWLQLEVEKEKCACDNCSYRSKSEKCQIPSLCKYGKSSHSHIATWDCEKIIRQRLKQRPYRTCHFCQENIPKDQFERKGTLYREGRFVNIHFKTCARNLMNSDNLFLYSWD